MPGMIMEQILLKTVPRHMENKMVVDHTQNDFTKGKFYLKNLLAFYDGVTAMLDEGRVTDIIYLDLCKVVDSVAHKVLSSKLERHEFDKWAIQWVKELSGWSHSKNCGQSGRQ